MKRLQVVFELVSHWCTIKECIIV